MTFGISDCLIGTILAYHTIQQFDMINFISGLAIAFATLFIANLLNSYYDRKNGVDTAEVANDRAMFELGLTKSNIFSALAFYTSVTLLSYAVLCYTTGPFPLKYHALGEMIPILYNGFIICGAYITQCHLFNVNILIYYIPFCLVGMGPMHTNNVRDIIPDTKAGITTIPMLLGHKWSCYNHCGAFILSFAILLIPLLTRFCNKQFSGLTGKFGYYNLTYAVLYSIGLHLSLNLEYI
eukprot:gene17165-20444_t